MISARSFAERLRQTKGKVRNIDLTEELKHCAEVVHEIVDDNFQAAVDARGVVWPPRKDKKKHPLLILTGRMLYAAMGGKGKVVEVTPRKLRMGIDPQEVPYAAVHQWGTPRVPRRQYYYVAGDQMTRLKDAFRSKVGIRLHQMLRGQE